MIRNKRRFDEAKPAGFDGVFEWDFLLPAWAPTIIEPMDLDGVVERRGYFLVFETKEDGAPIKDGQRITLEAFVKTGKVTVFVLWGKTAETIRRFDVWWLDKNGTVRKESHIGDADDVTKLATRWFQWASNGGRKVDI